MKPKSPVLVNAAQMAKDNPATFSRPSKKQISRLRSGALIKVAIVGQPTAERIWCEIVSGWETVSPGGTPLTFIARIENEPVFTASHGIEFNDLVFVAPDNIYAIQQEDGASHSGAIII